MEILLHCWFWILQNQLLLAFKNGKYKDFFVLWNKSLPAELRDANSTCKKLEFHLNIYFAVYPILSGKKVIRDIQSIGVLVPKLTFPGSMQ